MRDYAQFYQNVGFHFAVSLNSIEKFNAFTDLDARFQSVSGLDAQIETESIKEGGENRFEHVVPTRRKYSDLTLKRGVLSPGDGSKFTEWCLEAFQGFEVIGGGSNRQFTRFKIQPRNLIVVLLNEEHEPLMHWEVIHAWPKAWKVGELNAEKSEVLIETLELHYNRLEFK